MSKWFRWYEGTSEDGKFRVVARNANVTVAVTLGVWAMLLEDASHPDHRGIATRGEHFYAAILDLEPEQVRSILEEMEGADLLKIEGGAIVISHWKERQFETDQIDATNTERQRRWREKQKKNTVETNRNDSVTVAKRPDTDTEAYTEKKDIRAVADATRTDDPFEEFWKSYPKREGRNPKAPARKKFLAALKSGIEAERITAGARRYRAECQAKQQIGTPYVAMAVTWLNQQSFEDYAPVAISPTGPPRTDLPSDEELRRKYGRNSTASAENISDAGQNWADRTDHASELLGTRTGDDPGKLSRECAGSPLRNAGIRSLGHVFRQSPALAALRDGDGGDGPEPGFDTPGAMAGVVRS